MLILLLVAFALPDRYSIFPERLAGPAKVTLATVAILASLLSGFSAFVRYQRAFAIGLAALASAVAAVYFATIFGRIAAGGSTLQGGPLLEAAITVWIMLVLTFSLWYWLLDSGSDFMFPQSESDRFANWKPTYVDYVALSFNTSTAFSPTDVLPASPRAKLMMMLQAAMSLATVALAAARAVNVLG
jgi:hypothetical protein